MSAVVIAGDTSGTITLQAPAVAGSTTFNLPATSGTLLNDATVGVCRAWVNFNGTGTVAIRASFNVSSITANGTGDYTVNFTNNMPDANYATNITGCNATNIAVTAFLRDAQAAPTTSAVRVGTINTSAAAADAPYVQVSVFR